MKNLVALRRTMQINQTCGVSSNKAICCYLLARKMKYHYQSNFLDLPQALDFAFLPGKKKIFTKGYLCQRFRDPVCTSIGLLVNSLGYWCLRLEKNRGLARRNFLLNCELKLGTSLIWPFQATSANWITSKIMEVQQ